MLQRLVTGLLAVAIRRWPSHLRETVAQEWAAELRALADETGVRGPVRAWRQLRFASSLALARPPAGDPVVVERMGWQASSWARAALLVSAPLLTMVATLVMLVPLQLIPFGYVTITPTSAALMTVESYLVLAGVAMAIGTWLARRQLRWRDGRPAGPAQCSWAVLPVIGGLLLLDGLARGGGQMWDSAWLAVVAALCLVLVLPLLARGAAALSVGGHRNLALAGAGLVAAILATATMYVVVLTAGQPWRLLLSIGQEPMLTVSYSGRGDEPPIESLLTVLPAFVFGTIVVALAHAIRLARPMPSVVSTVAAVPAAAPVRPVRVSAPTDTQVPEFARSPWWHRTLLGGAAFSVIAWAVTLTYLTPNIGVQNSWASRNAIPNQPLPAQPGGWLEWSSEEGRLWMQELQMLSIVCAMLCFIAAMAYRSRPVLPAVTGSVVLVATNMTVVRAHWTIPRLFPFLAAGGLLLGMAAWWWSLRLSRHRPVEPRPRRLIITIAILAAILVPGSFFPRIYAFGKQAPPVLLLVAVGLPTVLTMLIFMGVRATSAQTWHSPTWLTPIGPAAVGVAGVLYYLDGLVPFASGDNPLVLVFFVLPLSLSVPAAVATAAAIRGRPAVPPRLWRVLLLIPMLLAAGYAFTFGAIVASLAIARLALFPMEYGSTYDGLAIVPGSVAIGLLFGFLAATNLDRADPDPTPVPADASAGAQDIDELGSVQPGPA